jgi:hypothetical protein
MLAFASMTSSLSWPGSSRPSRSGLNSIRLDRANVREGWEAVFQQLTGLGPLRADSVEEVGVAAGLKS